MARSARSTQNKIKKAGKIATLKVLYDGSVLNVLKDTFIMRKFLTENFPILSKRDLFSFINKFSIVGNISCDDAKSFIFRRNKALCYSAQFSSSSWCINLLVPDLVFRHSWKRDYDQDLRLISGDLAVRGHDRNWHDTKRVLSVCCSYPINFAPHLLVFI